MANIDDRKTAALREVERKDLAWHTPAGIEVKPLYAARTRPTPAFHIVRVSEEKAEVDGAIWRAIRAV